MKRGEWYPARHMHELDQKEVIAKAQGKRLGELMYDFFIDQLGRWCVVHYGQMEDSRVRPYEFMILPTSAHRFEPNIIHPK